MAADPESDVLAIIEAGGVWTEDTDMFRGPVLPPGQVGETFPIPHEAVFVRLSSSSPPLVHRSSAREEKEYLIDIVLRGDRNDYGGARTKAQAILDLVNDNPPTGYIDAKTQTSHPLWVEQDDSGSHYFSITVRLRKIEA